MQCALATTKQNNRISSHQKRILKRQGKMKARVASAHLILTIAYNILKTGEPYKELGPEYVQHKKKQGMEQKMIKFLKEKGYTITLLDQEAI